MFSATLKIKVGNIKENNNWSLDSIEPVDPPRGITVSDFKHSNGEISFKYNASADCEVFERNQLFLLRASYDTPPNRRGMITRRKISVTLPVRRITVKQ